MFVYIKENEMKKVALSLLAFALVGALAVAQDAPTLKLSGYLNTGVKVTTNDGTTQTIFGDDAGANWGRFDLNGAYATETSGVTWSLRVQDPEGAKNTSGYAPAIKYAYAWSKFANGLVTVKAGSVDDGTFTTVGDIGDDFADDKSILAIVTPVAGLNLGASWYLPVGGGSTPLGYAFHAAYTADKLASVQANVKIADSKVTDSIVSIGVLALDKLTLALENKTTGWAYYATTGALATDLNVGYAVTDALSVGLLSYVYTWGSDVKFPQDNAGKADAPLGYSVKPSVSYTIDPVISVGANVKYAKGPQGTPSKDALDAIVDLATIDAFLATGYTNDASFFEVNPSVTFTLSPAAKIITGVVYDASADDKKLAYNGKASQTVYKIDFRYNF